MMQMEDIRFRLFYQWLIVFADPQWICKFTLILCGGLIRYIWRAQVPLTISDNRLDKLKTGAAPARAELAMYKSFKSRKARALFAKGRWVGKRKGNK